MARMLIDLTQPLNCNIPVYPGDPLFSCQQSCNVPRDGYSVHVLSCSSHAGTHIDAPSHFFANGATIDQFPLSAFMRPALVLDVSHKQARECITWDTIEPVADRIRPGTAVLFRTGWSRYYHYHHHDEGTHHQANARYFDHPWLAPDVAQRLVALGVRLIGTDTMSFDQSPVGGSDFGVHRAVLGAGGLIVENLTNLDALLAAQDGAGPDEEVVVSLLPLNIAGCDGSPVRAVAWLQPRGLFS
ncbi:putative cyclase [Lactifluus subvellereus]|nr:putative cyclase [Lactifluus subvellereus]